MALYLADTNIYVSAANDPAVRHRFETFIQQHGPLVVSAVVVAEVLIGLPGDRHHDAAKAITAGGACLEPSPDDWLVAAQVVVKLCGARITKSRSFWNDVLLAALCSRLGLTLVTANLPDFRRIGRHLPLESVAPFPRAR